MSPSHKFAYAYAFIRTPHPDPAMHFASLNPMGFTSFNLPQGERGFSSLDGRELKGG